MHTRRPRSAWTSLKALGAALALALLPAPLSATWSIVVVNTETGEVGIASATCLNDFDLKEGAGVIVVGMGAAQAQAALDAGANRQKIFNVMKNGKDATKILEKLAESDPTFEFHQYGIVTLHPDTATHTGAENSNWAGGLTGSAGPLHYAIQGNILTCETVITAAEEALVTTRGDTATKLMAAMWAARAFGGDNRCSCNGGPPLCGCPPTQFNKSARVGYVTVARIGDTDGVCNPGVVCANGDYYLDLNVTETPAPDPVLQLQPMPKEFRKQWRGHADHLHSKKVVLCGGLPADGLSSTSLELSLVDIHRNPLGSGGASISVTHSEESAAIAAIGAVTDHGDGTYSVALGAGLEPGTDVLRVVVEDGMGPVTLYPFPTLEHLTPALTVEGGVDFTDKHESLDHLAPLVLAGGSDLAGRAFAILGEVAEGERVPLSWGVLDSAGSARVELPPWGVPTGVELALELSWVCLDPVDFASNELQLTLTSTH